MSRHVDREMTRARVRASLRLGAGASTEFAPLIRSLMATLARTPAGMRLTFEPCIPDGATTPFDRTDLAEVLGNLLDNASRHAVSRVRVTAYPGPAGASIAIVDEEIEVADKAVTEDLN